MSDQQGSPNPAPGAPPPPGPPPQSSSPSPLPPEGSLPHTWRQIYSDPVVFLTTVIVFSVILLIGAAVVGLDKGVLAGMSKSEYARGLITYLFALVTIVIAVALVLSALTATEIKFEERFKNAKEILALLLGIFGTIMGFYFASETSRRSGDEPLSLSSLDVTPQPGGSPDQVMLRAVVRGGAPPYRFAVQQGKAPTATTDVAGEGGWIVKQLKLHPKGADESESVYVLVEDQNRKRAEQAAPITSGIPPSTAK